MSFRREKYVARGGPDGGDGGRGGDIILQASDDLASLLPLFYAPHQHAEDGTHGKGKELYGKSGRDLVVPVPCGTEVWDEEAGELLGDLVHDGDRLMVARGGARGKGNCHWVSPTHRAPREHTPGAAGEQKTLRLILKTVADIGIIGFPNAGKSSLLTKISRAHPTVAPYPFTTLHPVIGTVVFDDLSLLKVADIPGLIEGAHEGVGLGYAFLRHIERSTALLVIIDMAATDGRDPTDTYSALLKELEFYEPGLLRKPRLVVANKMDLPEAKGHLRKFEKALRLRAIRISALTGDGIDKLQKSLYRLGKKIAK